MSALSRPVASALLGVGLLVTLTSCGGNTAEGTRTTIAEVQPTSYVVKPPVTTTTTTTTIAQSVGTGTPCQTSPTEQIYTVVAGDSLSKIANAHGITLEALINYNGWTDGTSHLILAGDPVKIPPNSIVPCDAPDTGTGTGTGTGSTDTPSTQTTAAPAGVACEHTVVANDNPTRVADQYGVSLEDLTNANIGNPAWNHFQLGSTIHIPPGGSC